MKIRKRRFAALEAVNRGHIRPSPGKCNYPNADSTKFCRQNAGMGTPHVGTGYCVRHDKTAYDSVHRYRGLKNKTIRERMEKLDSQERDIFDIIPEIQLLRMLIIDFVDRFQQNQEAVHAWYFKEKRRPKTLLDITEVSGLVEAVTRIIERKHRIESKEAISLETFRRVAESMGVVVARHVRDHKVLSLIEAEWASLSLDAKSTTGMTVPSVEPRMLTDGADTDTDTDTGNDTD